METNETPKEEVKTPTPEEQEAKVKEFNERVKNFNADLIPLLKKYKLALGATPFITQNGTINAQAQLFDDIKKEEPKVGDKPPELNKA